MNIIMSIFLLGLFSCSKETEYNFQIYNQTKYLLNEVSFDWCSGGKKISINPNSALDVTLSYKTSGVNIFGSGSLCITVLTYADNVSILKNAIGVSIERSNLNKKNRNIIRISEKASPVNSNIFSIELE